ncbi:hypothetical protein HYV88_04305 [Candidatus Woesearchaeota archaeon]|nr:hypothetical protein [Candidatus Woesearchaeota archaeon]
MSNFMLLQENREHPDIEVAKYRLASSKEARRAGRYLGLNLQNNDQGFVGNINHQDALDLVTRLNGFTLFPGYFAEFLREIRDGGSDRNHKVYDENGKRIKVAELKLINRDITEQTCCSWKGEHLDLFVSCEDDDLFVEYHRVNTVGRLVPVETELDKGTLMTDKCIDLYGWLIAHTSQGLPLNNNSGGGLDYSSPGENSVVWFGVGSARVGLSCGGDSRVSDSALGVRLARVKI